MNKEQQRIKIAEACGFTVVSDGITHCLTPCNFDGMYAPEGKLLKKIPDYLNDLNELAAARDQLIVTPELRIKWANTLRDVVGHTSPHRNKAGKPVVSDIDILFATAEQLSETLLRTLKLWADKA